MTADFTPERRARLEEYADWLADPHDEGNPYDLPIDDEQPKEDDIRAALAEIDRLKTALREISESPYRGVSFYDLQGIAARALKATAR